MNTRENRIILGLTFCLVVLSALNYLNKENNKTYVLTPLIDVIPSEYPLSQAEVKVLETDLRYQAEARDMQKAYARMGSTLSFHDLLVGIEFLEKSKFALSAKQEKEIRTKLKRMKYSHKRLQDIQQELIVLERQLANDVQSLEKRP